MSSVWNDFFQGNISIIWHGITHAHWSNVWAAISAIFTALAVIVAGWAMARWRKQDELKVKMAFKTAVSEYLVSTVSYAVLYKHDDKDSRIPEHRNKVYEDFAACRHAWWMREGLLDRDKAISDAWDFIRLNHSKFVDREISDDDIYVKCRIILSKKFVFK